MSATSAAITWKGPVDVAYADALANIRGPVRIIDASADKGKAHDQVLMAVEYLLRHFRQAAWQFGACPQQ